MKTHYIISETKHHNKFACGLVRHKANFNGKEKLKDVTCKNCIKIIDRVQLKQYKGDAKGYDKNRI